MKDTIMKTDRMILRKMRRDDAENLLEIFSDPTAMEYYPSTKNEKQTLQMGKRNCRIFSLSIKFFILSH
ncbi:GNAT family N-acetyltransferase [Bacillus paralicheniformis]|uniref:GNAT family N-acetyltransferase n=1 Tax=Bacillus paralicheniformis TaxID=1648923 RepID=UPI0040453901